MPSGPNLEAEGRSTSEALLLEQLNIVTGGCYMAGILITAIIILIVFSRIVRCETVYIFEKGLKYHRGQFAQILDAGQYWYLTLFTRIRKIDTRIRFVTVQGQELLSSDSIALKISLAAKTEVTDPQRAVHSTQDFNDATYLELQLALREIIAEISVDDVLSKRKEISEKLASVCGEKLESIGVKLHSVAIKDVMFPGELKKIFSQQIKAQKESLAGLEKARGEAATLRKLANVSRMLEDNPALMQLRLLQSISDSSGNTIVLEVPPTGRGSRADSSGAADGVTGDEK